MVVVEEVQFTAPAATAGAAVLSNTNKSNNKSNNKSDSCSSAANNNSSSSMSNEQQQLDYQMAGMKKIGRTLKTALLKAQAAGRVIVGLQAAINMLSQTPEGSLFCLMAVPQVGDAATHMHEVLLEAFCYENDIYVIKVDCPNKLSRILGKNSLESCCLVQKAWVRRSSTGTDTDTDTFSNASDDDDDELLNKSETILVDYCEAYWDSPHSPIIELPPV